MAYTDENLQGVLIFDKDETGKVLFGTCSGEPPTTADEFAAGAVMIDRVNAKQYVNTGTSASPVWENVAEVDAEDLNAAASVTATADGLTTGLIPSTARHVIITSANADHIVTLPSPVIGKVITMYVGANGCELRTAASSNIKINEQDSDGTKEAALPATTLAKVTCTSATTWILEAVDELGAVITAIVPD